MQILHPSIPRMLNLQRVPLKVTLIMKTIFTPTHGKKIVHSKSVTTAPGAKARVKK